METTALTFGEPGWLFGLAAVPALAILYWFSYRNGRKLIDRLVAPRLREQLAGTLSAARRIVRAGLVLSALAFIVIAMAQPRMGYRELEIKTQGRDVVLAIDVSRSMLATDVPPNRLERARLFSRDLLEFLRGDRIGVVAFAGSSFLQAPLTLDQSAILATLDEINPDLIPKGGTNLAAAIRTSLAAFSSAEGKSRAIVIITDGEELDADGVSAAREAADQGVVIFTIGIGSAEGSLIPIVGDRGKQEFVRGPDGKPVTTKLDSARLEEIANITNGFYLPLAPNAAKELFFAGIESLQRVESGSGNLRQPNEQYLIPTVAAIVFLIVWLLVGERKWQRLSAKTALFLVSLLFLSQTPASAFSPNAFSLYEKKDYAAASDAFLDNAKTGYEVTKNYFNAGVAAYKAGQYEKAVDAFSQALLDEDRDLQEKAQYNLGNTLVQIGEKEASEETKKRRFEDAIEKYKHIPENSFLSKNAKENIEIVEEKIEEIKKRKKQKDQKKDKQDQQKDQQDQKDKQDQQKDQQDQKDKQDQQKDQQDQKDKQDQQKDQQDQKDKQDQQKDQQDQKDKQDQQKDQQDQKDKQDQQKDQQDQKDKQDQQKDQQDQKDKQDQQKDQQDQKDKQDQQKDQQDQKDKQSSPQDPQVDQQKPQEKKQGELSANENQQESPEAQAVPEVEERDGEMSEMQARALLEALRNEEERVKLNERARKSGVIRDW